MERKDIKINVFKEPIPISLKPIQITLLGKPADAVLYMADFKKGYAELRVALGNNDIVTAEELFPRRTLKRRLEELKEEIKSILDDHDDLFEKLSEELYNDFGNHCEALKNMDEVIEELVEYIDEEGYEQEEIVEEKKNETFSQINLFDREGDE
jgi:hypothetical protein